MSIFKNDAEIYSNDSDKEYSDDSDEENQLNLFKEKTRKI